MVRGQGVPGSEDWLHRRSRVGQNDALEFGFIDPNTIQVWSPNGGMVNVDITDLVVEDENRVRAAVASVSEPSACVLALIGLLALAWRRC